MIDAIRLSRRHFLTAAGATAVTGALGAPAIAQSAGKPLKIGMVTSLSGPFTALGQSMRAGMQLFLDENKGAFAGRTVEFIVEDDQAKPDEGVRKFRKLIGQDNVDIICGVISSGVALAVRDVVTEAKVLTFISAGSANDLARKAASPLVFRPTKTNWQLGSKTGKQVWTPLGTTDFGPLLTTIAAEQPEFVYSFFAGSDAVRFLQQMREYRLAGRIKLVGTGALFDQEDVLPAVGEAANGAVNTFHQSPTAPASKTFSEAYLKFRGKLPGEMSTSGYVTGQTIKAALDAVQGDLGNKEKVKEALLAAPLETAFGPMSFDPRNNQAILDVYVNEIRPGADGKAVNQVIHTYKGVRDPGPSA